MENSIIYYIHIYSVLNTVCVLVLFLGDFVACPLDALTMQEYWFVPLEVKLKFKEWAPAFFIQVQ